MNSQQLVICFFVLFLIVYFLEAIGGFYMTSAVVSIEKQFQITSQMSGLMVSAGDFGYIPSVIFVSYLGGKGNRARWIGGGCLMVAIADILISASNFLFPVEFVRLNSTYVENSLEMDPRRLNESELVESFVNFTTQRRPLENKEEFAVGFPVNSYKIPMKDYATNNLGYCYPKNLTIDVCDRYFEYLHEVNTAETSEISNIRILTSAPYTFCSIFVNTLRAQVGKMKCSRDPSNLGPFVTIFVGLLILGVGRTMPFSLGLPLIDDNVKRKNLPLYFAGMFFIRILGPVLGFLIGSITNKFYYSFDVPPGLTPRDPLWIGRWWAGFLGIGLALLCPSIALFLFPSKSKRKNSSTSQQNYHNDNDNSLKKDANLKVKLEGDSSVQMQPLVKETEATDQNKGATKPEKGHHRNRSLALVDRHIKANGGEQELSFSKKVDDFIMTVKKITKQPVYMGALIGRILDVLAFKGFFLFMPKYLEVQFGLPQHKISLYMGIIGISGFAVGVVIGSFTMRKFKLQGRKAAAWVALCSTAAAILSFLNATVGCKSALSSIGEFAMANKGSFGSSCNAGCSCNGVPLYPVCNSKGVPFYSPCHAGCPLNETFPSDSHHKIFYNCECSNTTDHQMSRDFCDESDCEWKSILYFVNISISGIFGGMGVIPAILIILRSVPPIDRSVSLGFQGFLVSLLATLPSPVIWGWIVDRSCVIWNEVCGGRGGGACAIYDSGKLRLTTHVTYGIMRLVSLLSDFWVFYYAKGLILTEEEPSKGEETGQATDLADDMVIDKDRKFSM